MNIIVDGNNLTIEGVVKVARDNYTISLSQDAYDRINICRDFVDEILHKGDIVYGLSTGFGKFSDTFIPKEDLSLLQKNLIMSHACGLGKPLKREVVRAAMLLRINALSKGYSGITMNTLQTLIQMLNLGVHPVIPEKGSLGASGDLAPLAHMVLVMLGEGEAEYKGEIMEGKKAMKLAGIKTIELNAKEGLALINGTQIMTGIACLVTYDAINLSKTADIISALSCEGLLAITKAFDPKVHEIRGQIGQIRTAQNMLRLLKGSRLSQETIEGKVQDAYTLRCIPQVHGASKDAFYYVKEIISREINAVTDNPLIFVNEKESISGGNFHGQPIALAMDFLAIALSELANISERRTERLLNPALSGLPAFLVKEGGLNSGLMIAQYAAAAIVSENKILSHPASVDSIPSSANQEDHVSMGTIGARKAMEILDNTQKVLAIELLSASQSIIFRDENKLSPVMKTVYFLVREQVAPILKDVITYKEINKLEKLIKANQILEKVESLIGKLND